MPNFESVLDMRADEIERPQPIPEGTYLAIVKGFPEEVEVGKDNTKAINYTMQFIRPQPDVNEDKLNTMLKGEALNTKTIVNRYFLTDKAAYRLKEFLFDHLGIDDGKGSKTLKAATSEAPGKQCYVVIGHRMSRDNQAVFAEVTRTMKC